jgi:hypothetical protein
VQHALQHAASHTQPSSRTTRCVKVYQVSLIFPASVACPASQSSSACAGGCRPASPSAPATPLFEHQPRHLQLAHGMQQLAHGADRFQRMPVAVTQCLPRGTVGYNKIVVGPSPFSYYLTIFDHALRDMVYTDTGGSASASFGGRSAAPQCTEVDGCAFGVGGFGSDHRATQVGVPLVRSASVKSR